MASLLQLLFLCLIGPAQFVTNQRNTPMLLHNKFPYVKKTRNGTLEDNDAARKKVSMEIRTKTLELMKNFSMEKIGEFVEGMMIYVCVIFLSL
jgi:hypothetical protein